MSEQQYRDNIKFFFKSFITKHGSTFQQSTQLIKGQSIALLDVVNELENELKEQKELNESLTNQLEWERNDSKQQKKLNLLLTNESEQRKKLNQSLRNQLKQENKLNSSLRKQLEQEKKSSKEKSNEIKLYQERLTKTRNALKDANNASLEALKQLQICKEKYKRLELSIYKHKSPKVRSPLLKTTSKFNAKSPIKHKYNNKKSSKWIGNTIKISSSSRKSKLNKTR